MIKYIPKKPVYIGFFTLWCVGILLTVGRWYSVINNDFVIFNAEVHSHISNFSLSILIYLGIGFFWLLLGVEFQFIVILGSFVVIANIVCETLMGFMNTPDIIDALYGIIGTAIAFVFFIGT